LAVQGSHRRNDRGRAERLDRYSIGAQTAENDYAVAFLVLAGRLGLAG
jgi:hypothetical protein